MKKVNLPPSIYTNITPILHSCSAEKDDSTSPPTIQQPNSEQELIQYTLNVIAGEGGIVSTEGGNL